MSDKFAVEIISPEKTILKTDASEVILPSYEGEIGILKNHIPLITFLRPGLIKIKGSMEIMFFAEDGTVEFVKNNLLILTSTAYKLSEISKTYIEQLLNKSETDIINAKLSDKEKYLLSHKIETLKNINL
mgnify:FL=1|tara:strand:- start:2716 stop:3105 length:390 start_codon:yes stop_codon:yes gene_type:complete